MQILKSAWNQGDLVHIGSFMEKQKGRDVSIAVNSRAGETKWLISVNMFGSATTKMPCNSHASSAGSPYLLCTMENLVGAIRHLSD